MENNLQYTFSNILNDPTTKLHNIGGYRNKKSEWNDYQRMETLNPLEMKFPIKYSRDHLISLAGIKKNIYNPVLPTLRSMDRDDVLCKLSTEHSRHNTVLNERQFNNLSYFLNDFNNQQETKFYSDEDLSENNRRSFLDDGETNTNYEVIRIKRRPNTSIGSRLRNSQGLAV